MLDLVDTFMKGMDWGMRLSYIAFAVAQGTVCVVGFISESRKLHFVMSFTMFFWQLVYSVLDLEVLGAF